MILCFPNDSTWTLWNQARFMAFLRPGTVSAWDSHLVPCRPCARNGCVFRVSSFGEYCCKRCEEFAAMPLTSKAQDETCGTCHDLDCSRLTCDTLKSSWWESVPCKHDAREDALWLVVPPPKFAELTEPTPVLLFLCGDGHVDSRQDFFSGGIDLLLQNSELLHHFIVLAPVPSTASGILRDSNSGGRACAWDEDGVWHTFTEVLRRLGPNWVDPSRLYATGTSLGAAGVWHLALRFGHHIAAIAPISGKCEWPGNSWPWSSQLPGEDFFRRLRRLPIRAYQTDTDYYAGSPRRDIEYLTSDMEEVQESLTVPGVELGSRCNVKIRRWAQQGLEARMELWEAAGPLTDWNTFGHKQKFNDHLLYHRVYPLPEWQLAAFFLRHATPESSQWQNF